MPVDALLIFVVLTNLTLLGSSRLGICVGLFTLAANPDHAAIHAVALAAGNILIKGVLFPWLLYRALRATEMRREAEPLVGYVASILLGVVLFALSLWIGSRMPLPSSAPSKLVLPVALFTIMVGLFLIIGRRKALTQVVGYIVLENGIYVFGVALLLDSPLLVELGVLLDVFVAVFVMGITILQMGRTFDDVDTDHLSTLKDWTP
jgi:hydrogenase-4 component E